MSTRPLIGVTAGSEDSARPYADAVERNGGEPLLILPDHMPSTHETVRRIDGLLVSGGASIDRTRYVGADRIDIDEDAPTAPQRDAVELPLLDAALDGDLPLLGVCRGMQVLNVIMGGSIMPELAGHGVSREGDDESSSYHRIYIAPGSKLAAIIGSGGFVRVNSRHQQGVREGQKSARLLASAYSVDDGVIECLESPEHRWVIGVQFHPERRMEVPPHFERLFRSLVERAQGS